MNVEDMNTQVQQATKALLFAMADDALIIAHRHSEWTGLGPLLEEDIAFSSIAQDKLGHAQALYQILHESFGEQHPDQLAFNRKLEAFRCCTLVELPNNGYNLALMRHFLFDAAEYFRYAALSQSSFEPLAALARKVTGEIKYHIYHARTWVIQLGSAGNAESKAKMQEALDFLWPYAAGMFEQDEQMTAALRDSAIYTGENETHAVWTSFVLDVFEHAGLAVPASGDEKLGGRNGNHTEYLQQLLDEMTEVFTIDPSAEW